MKIVILVSYTYPFVGSGLGQVALIQAEGLAKLGHEVVVVSGNVPKTKSKFKRNGVLHIKLKSADFLNRFSIPVPFFVFNKEVIEHFKSADVIHCHDMLYPYSLQGALLAKFLGKPFILTQHAGFILYKSKLVNLIQVLVNKTFGRIVLLLSDKILVVNEEVKKWLGENGKNAMTLMNGVNTKLFHPVTPDIKRILRKKYGFPLNKKIVLYVGRLVEKKGFHRMYESRSEKYLTLIAGGGEIPVHMNNEKKKVIFLGSVSQEKLAEIYQLSDVFALPSDCEGFPLSIQEAMATGLPIISSNHPGFDKYMDKKYVKLINPFNGELKKALVEVVMNKDKREKMRKYSLNSKSLYANWESNLNNLLNIYKSSLG